MLEILFLGGTLGIFTGASIIGLFETGFWILWLVAKLIFRRPEKNISSFIP
mgnify:CR=1 FL=1